MQGLVLGLIFVRGADGAGTGTVGSAVTVVLPQRRGGGVNALKARRPFTGLRAHLLLPQILHPAHERQVEADPEAVLEEERRSAAVQLPFGDDGDAVAEEVSLIHVMGGENHRPACTTAQ